MYATLIGLLFTAKLFVICFYFCLLNLIWWWCVCVWWDTIHMQLWFSIMVHA